eukprot:snap_masked-scaffold_3-processed-gene-2.18-mRNA-1 protein AED:1.00 eAED:1.00 QI:0/-1/0/0/-1/1/1/0/110
MDIVCPDIIASDHTEDKKDYTENRKQRDLEIFHVAGNPEILTFETRFELERARRKKFNKNYYPDQCMENLSRSVSKGCENRIITSDKNTVIIFDILHTSTTRFAWSTIQR